MEMGWEVSAGPAGEGFPHSAVLLKMGAEDEVVVAKSTGLTTKCCFARRRFQGK